jgi:hypothetical protein
VDVYEGHRAGEGRNAIGNPVLHALRPLTRVFDERRVWLQRYAVDKLRSVHGQPPPECKFVVNLIADTAGDCDCLASTFPAAGAWPSPGSYDYIEPRARTPTRAGARAEAHVVKSLFADAYPR